VWPAPTRSPPLFAHFQCDAMVLLLTADGTGNRLSPARATWSGSLQQVIVGLLDGYNHVIGSRQGECEVLVIDAMMEKLTGSLAITTTHLFSRMRVPLSASWAGLASSSCAL